MPPAPQRADADRSTDGTGATTSASRHMDRVVGVLDRVVPFARVARIGVVALAATAAFVVVLGALLIGTLGTDPDAIGWLGLLAAVAIALIPSLLLVGLVLLLSTVVNLPDRLRKEPGLRKDQVVHLASLAAGHDPSTGEAGLSRGRRAWRATRLLVSARADLLEYALLLRLASVPYLAVSGLAAVAAALLIVLVPLLVATVLAV